MILCLPFLMFQGRAQEAIDHYLETFPDAELLEIMHHPEGTELYDPAQEASAATTLEVVGEHDEDPAGDHPETADADEALPESDPESDEPQRDAEPPAPRFDDTAALETVIDWETTLVATAQMRIGGQLLMIQDSLSKRDFDFTASISMAVVVDTEDEFTRITDRLAEGGAFLMEPGDYEFAANFAWVRDRFGVTWQINQSPSPSSPEGPEVGSPAAQAQAADHG